VQEGHLNRNARAIARGPFCAICDRLLCLSGDGSTSGWNHNDNDIYKIEEAFVPKYVIERELPGAGKLNAAQLKAISQTSCGVLQTLGPQIQWVHSYVTDDKIYCIYIAPNAEMVREHARRGQFPANSVAEVKAIIDPTSAEAPLVH
jgi:hypothetical protein